jgi:mannose-1-phosphate guanylyltransferase
VKERVTVTIERSLLKVIDSSVDGMQVKNRSHAVELLIERALKQVLPSHAVILAGGDSKKLLKAVNGKPVILHNIELLSQYGVNTIFMLIGKDPAVQEFLGDGSKYDVHITYFEEKEAMGTAGALNLIREQLTSSFILMNGDELKLVDLKDMFNFHKQHHGLCTIALTSVQDPSQYGVALLNGNYIVAFVEKPTGKNAPSNLISAGLYMLERDVLPYVPKGYARLETDVFPKLAKENKLIGYPFSGQYIDTDNEEGITERLTSIFKGIRDL